MQINPMFRRVHATSNFAAVFTVLHICIAIYAKNQKKEHETRASFNRTIKNITKAIIYKQLLSNS